MEVDSNTFGLTAIIVGMGGTLLTLWIITLLIQLLARIFPAKDRPSDKQG